MKVTSITKGMNIKFATLPYSNADINVHMTAELADGDDIKKAGTELTKLLMTEIAEFKSAMDETVVELFDKPKSL